MSQDMQEIDEVFMQRTVHEHEMAEGIYKTV